MSTPWLSIVVPVRNGMTTLPRLLEGLGEFEDAADIEIVFVDDASTDETRGFLTERGHRVLHRAERGGPAAARNDGVRATSGGWILFLDADTVPPKTTPARIRAASRIPGVVGVVGVYSGTPANSGFWPRYKATQAEFYHSSTDTAEITFLWAAMGAVRRDVFLTVGGFDERYTGAMIEDVELGRRLAVHGRILLDRQFVVGHHFPATLRRNARDHFVRGRLWVELCLRSGQFENYLCTPGMATSRFAILAVPFCLVVALFPSPLRWPALLVAAASAGAYEFATRGFLSLALRRYGPTFVAGVVCAEFALSAILVAATAAAFLNVSPSLWLSFLNPSGTANDAAFRPSRSDGDTGPA